MVNQDFPGNVSEIALLRATLDEVFSDHRFFVRRSFAPCHVANFVLTRILQGERNFDRLKASTFEKLEDECCMHGHPPARGHRDGTSKDLALDFLDSRSSPEY
jgi:hypothetical protein